MPCKPSLYALKLIKRVRGFSIEYTVFDFINRCTSKLSIPYFSGSFRRGTGVFRGLVVGALLAPCGVTSSLLVRRQEKYDGDDLCSRA